MKFFSIELYYKNKGNNNKSQKEMRKLHKGPKGPEELRKTKGKLHKRKNGKCEEM